LNQAELEYLYKLLSTIRNQEVQDLLDKNKENDKKNEDLKKQYDDELRTRGEDHEKKMNEFDKSHKEEMGKIIEENENYKNTIKERDKEKGDLTLNLKEEKANVEKEKAKTAEEKAKVEAEKAKQKPIVIDPKKDEKSGGNNPPDPVKIRELLGGGAPYMSNGYNGNNSDEYSNRNIDIVEKFNTGLAAIVSTTGLAIGVGVTVALGVTGVLPLVTAILVGVGLACAAFGAGGIAGYMGKKTEKIENEESSMNNNVNNYQSPTYGRTRYPAIYEKAPSKAPEYNLSDINQNKEHSFN
jgi:hypothetical protein